MKTPDKYFDKTENNEAAFMPHIYEIHGNVRYMHCSDEEEDHSSKLHPSPTLEEAEAYKAIHDSILVPKCQLCQKIMKPHCMFFDESYCERFYRYETVA